jgi:hypothetical protein
MTAISGQARRAPDPPSEGSSSMAHQIVSPRLEPRPDAHERKVCQTRLE